MISITSQKEKEILNAINYFLTNQSVSIKDCAKLFNIHRETLSSRLKALDIHEDRRKYKFNENYFDIIDDEGKAYWLGFLLADGCLKKDRDQVSLRISKTDINHLLKFKRCIDSQHPIHTEKTVLKNNIYCMATLKLQSKKFYNDIKKYGIYPNKSMNEICFEEISENYLRHYIRGIYDGDGWLYQNSNCIEVGFGMGYEALRFIKHCFEVYAGVKEYNIKKHKNIYRYRITSKKEIEKAFNFMYSGANVYLDRKYESYLNCRLR